MSRGQFLTTLVSPQGVKFPRRGELGPQGRTFVPEGDCSDIYLEERRGGQRVLTPG
jgi:hypothetical protein